MLPTVNRELLSAMKQHAVDAKDPIVLQVVALAEIGLKQSEMLILGTEGCRSCEEGKIVTYVRALECNTCRGMN